MNKLNRRMAVAGVVLGVAAMSATPAQAAEKVWDEHFDYELVMPGVDNPCTPQFDDITLNATISGFYKAWEQDGQFVKSVNRWQNRVDGQAADGTRYGGTYQGRADGDIRDGWAHFTSDYNERLTSQGSAPNFHLRVTIKSSYELNGPGWAIELVRHSAECRG